MKKYTIEIRWAIIFIVITLLWMVMERAAGLHSTRIEKHPFVTMFFLIPAIWVYILALKDKKRSFYQGKMSFIEGLISGSIITAIITICSPLTQWIISYVITPDYFKNVINYCVQNGMYKTITEAEAHFNFKDYAIQSTIWALISGLITTVVVMIFLRTKPDKKAIEN